MNYYDEADFVIDVVCDHNNAPCPAPDRVAARLYHKPAPAGLVIGFQAWREALNPEADYPPAAQTYFGELRRLIRDLPRAEQDEILCDPGRQQRLLSARSSSGDEMGGQRWRFWCRDCGATLLRRHSRLAPILAKLREHGVERVTLNALGSL